MEMAEQAVQTSEVMGDGFATVLEAARFLKLGRSKVYDLMDAGALRYAKFGKARRLPWAVVRQYAEACLVGGPR
jgi:excisionase family DNA binding protein